MRHKLWAFDAKWLIWNFRFSVFAPTDWIMRSRVHQRDAVDLSSTGIGHEEQYAAGSHCNRYQCSEVAIQATRHFDTGYELLIINLPIFYGCRAIFHFPTVRVEWLFSFVLVAGVTMISITFVAFILAAALLLKSPDRRSKIVSVFRGSIGTVQYTRVSTHQIDNCAKKTSNGMRSRLFDVFLCVSNARSSFWTTY